jgi:hypothetical protein
MSPFREFLLWLLKQEDIRVSTVCIEYFKVKNGDSDPIILKFGHRSRVGPIEEK